MTTTKMPVLRTKNSIDTINLNTTSNSTTNITLTFPALHMNNNVTIYNLDGSVNSNFNVSFPIELTMDNVTFSRITLDDAQFNYEVFYTEKINTYSNSIQYQNALSQSYMNVTTIPYTAPPVFAFGSINFGTAVHDDNGNTSAYRVPITVSNSQTTATGTNFQQLISFTPSSLSSYINPNCENIFFTDSNLNLLDSWIENATSSTSSGSVNIWVKIPNINANSNITIYMYINSTTTTSALSTNHTGAQPNYTSTYGQYDNGANVFNLYDNFAGNTLSSKWTSSGMTITIDNGLTLTSVAANGLMYFSSGSTSGALVCEAYANLGAQTTSTPVSFGAVYTSFTPGYSGTFIISGYPSANNYYGMQSDGGSTSLATTLLSGSFEDAILSILSPNVNNSTYQYNYSGVTLSTERYATPVSFGIVGSPFGGAYTFSPSPFFQWIRTRVYPPDQIMPTLTFSTVSAISLPSCTIYPTNSGLLYFEGEVYNTATSAVTFTILNPDGSTAYSLDVPANSPPETFKFYSPNWIINNQYVFTFNLPVGLTFNYFFCRETY